MKNVDEMTIAEVVEEVISLRLRVKELEGYEPILIDNNKCPCGEESGHDPQCPLLILSLFVEQHTSRGLTFSRSQFKQWFHDNVSSGTRELFEEVLALTNAIQKYDFDTKSFNLDLID